MRAIGWLFGLSDVRLVHDAIKVEMVAAIRALPQHVDAKAIAAQAKGKLKEW